MFNQMPLINVDLHISPGFSGRIMLYVENGLVKSEIPLLPEEIIGTPVLFDHILERAGYRVTPVKKD
ncbi:hypothetical protein RQN31_02425 [Citrobacter freundii]|uniref:hypothetical protein n=1 Tax=Citrobacter freundii TaxID=546 RepID=UPI0008FCE82D|nr:hypothetical protein [Citrobacter freundii]MDT7353292.1 hypothetical protein [Citrobacter freundii]OIZ48975.1 hypothetical protein BEH71_13285 [Citrobacter freundii]